MIKHLHAYLLTAGVQFTVSLWMLSHTQKSQTTSPQTGPGRDLNKGLKLSSADEVQFLSFSSFPSFIILFFFPSFPVAVDTLALLCSLYLFIYASAFQTFSIFQLWFLFTICFKLKGVHFVHWFSFSSNIFMSRSWRTAPVFYSHLFSSLNGMLTLTSLCLFLLHTCFIPSALFALHVTLGPFLSSHPSVYHSVCLPTCLLACLSSVFSSPAVSPELPPRYLLGQGQRPNTITHVCWYRNQNLSLTDYLRMNQVHTQL